MTSSFRTDPCVLDDFVSLAKFRALCKRVGVDPESARAVLLIEGAGGEATRAALAERLRLSSVEASRLIDNLEI